MIRRWWWVFILMLCVGALIGLGVARLMAGVLPKEFESSAVIELGPPKPDEEISPDRALSAEVLKSDEMLMRLAKSLNRDERLKRNREVVIAELRSAITVAPVFGTNRVAVSARSDHRYECHEMVNQLIGVYENFRRETEKATWGSSFTKEMIALPAQKEKVKQGREALAAMSKTQRLHDLKDPAQTGTVSGLGYYQAKKDQEADEAVLAELLTWEREQAWAKKADVIIRVPSRHGVEIPRDTKRLEKWGLAIGALLSPLLAWFLVRFMLTTSINAPAREPETSPEMF